MERLVRGIWSEHRPAGLGVPSESLSREAREILEMRRDKFSDPPRSAKPVGRVAVGAAASIWSKRGLRKMK
jgi:hypothetical protein